MSRLNLRNRRMRDRLFPKFGYAALLMAAFLFAGERDVHAQAAGTRAKTPADPLSRGIALYHAGRDSESLSQLRIVVARGGNRALAYYYAARIRMREGNMLAVRKNLLAALADSAGFHDATGLLAWTNLKMGNRPDALIEWRRFVQAVNPSDSGKVTAASIMLPEEYRKKAAVPLTTHAPPDPHSAVQSRAPADSTLPAFGKTDAARIDTAEIDSRIESQIRRGYYGVGLASALLILGLAGTAWWMRRRRKDVREMTFSAEVDRMIEEAREAGEFDFDDDGERLEREFERRRREIVEESVVLNHETEPAAPPKDAELPVLPLSRSPKHERGGGEEPIPPLDFEDSGDIFPAAAPAPARKDRKEEHARPPITEEIKALVSRMYREGRSVLEIARTADLTRTEVELIVAVRARDIEQLVEAAREDDIPDEGNIPRAIREMNAEGRSVVEIARTLGISITEVKLALAMTNTRRGRR